MRSIIKNRLRNKTCFTCERCNWTKDTLQKYINMWEEHPPDTWCKEHSSRPEYDTCDMWTDEFEENGEYEWDIGIAP